MPVKGGYDLLFKLSSTLLPVVNRPPALPDLLITGVARGAVTQPVSVQLDHPPPVTGVRREAFAGAQGVHQHWITVK